MQKDRKFLLEKVSCMEKIINQNLSSNKSSKKATVLRPKTSVLQYVDYGNIANGTMKCIRGGLLKDVRENIQS